MNQGYKRSKPNDQQPILLSSYLQKHSSSTHLGPKQLIDSLQVFPDGLGNKSPHGNRVGERQDTEDDVILPSDVSECDRADLTDQEVCREETPGVDQNQEGRGGEQPERADSLASHADMEDRAVPLDRIPVVKIEGGTAQLIGPIPKEKAALKIYLNGVPMIRQTSPNYGSGILMIGKTHPGHHDERISGRSVGRSRVVGISREFGLNSTTVRENEQIRSRSRHNSMGQRQKTHVPTAKVAEETKLQ